MATIFDPTNPTAGIKPEILPASAAYELPRQSLCYDVGDWSRYLYSQEVGDGEMLRSLVSTVGKRPDGETCEALLGEIFAKLYDFDAMKLEQPSEHARDWAPKLHAIAEESDAWKRLVEMARSDSYVSALATATVGEAVIKEMPEHLPKDPEKVKSEIDGLEQLERVTRGKRKKRIQKRLAEMRAELEAIQYTAEEATAEMDARAIAIADAIEESSKSVMVMVADAKKAVEAFGGEAAASEALSGTMMGAGTGPGTARRRQLKRVLGDEKLRRIADLAGRFRARVRAEKRAKSDGPEEIHSVELGDNLQRLLPIEKMRLGGGGIGAALVYSRMLDRGAQQYAVKSNDKRSRGPIVFVLDESGSMDAATDSKGTTRDEWSKAVSLAVMQRCIEERRSFAIVHFAESVKRVDLFAKPWESGMESVCDAMAYFADGGTRISVAIEKAAKLASGKGWKPTNGESDLVLVTDGVDGSLTTQMIKDHLGDVALHTIGISCRIPKEIADASSSVTEYTDSELGKGVLPDVAVG